MRGRARQHAAARRALARLRSALIVALASLALALPVACEDHSSSQGPGVPEAEAAASPPAAQAPGEDAKETAGETGTAAPAVAEVAPESVEPAASAAVDEPVDEPEVDVEGPAEEPPEVEENPEIRRNDRLSAAVSLPFYPGARTVPSLSSEDPDDIRVVLTTNDPCDRVVRFYEQHTGQVAQTTNLSDGDIYDIVLQTGKDGMPLHGVQVRETPRAIADRLSGHTSVILFRRAP